MKLSMTLLSQNIRCRTEYKWFLPFQTRFLDNDRYGHMNNAVYHGIFDSVINIFLIRHCGLDIQMGKSSSRVGFMVTNKCQFFGLEVLGLNLSGVENSQEPECQFGAE